MSGYGRQIIVTSAIAAVLVIGIGVGLYYTTMTGTTSNNSVQAVGDQTVTANYVNALNAIATTTSSQTAPGGAYTYSPSSSVKIVSVQAFTSQSGSGNQTVSFSVEFQNVGSSTINVVTGGGSSLNATILSGPVHELFLKAKCEIVTAQIPVGPGENFISSTPGCASGYTYMLSQPGSIQVELTLSWSGTASTGGASGGMIDIMSEFTLN